MVYAIVPSAVAHLTPAPGATIDSHHYRARMTESYAFIPGRTPPKRRLHPALWAAIGAVVALLAAGGAWLVLRPAAASPADDRRTRGIHLCEESIRDKLLSPSSAQFSGETWSAGPVSWTVTGNVDAQNTSGAMLRDPWECTLVETNGVLSVALATLHDDN